MILSDRYYMYIHTFKCETVILYGVHAEVIPVNVLIIKRGGCQEIAFPVREIEGQTSTTREQFSVKPPTIYFHLGVNSHYINPRH